MSGKSLPREKEGESFFLSFHGIGIEVFCEHLETRERMRTLLRGHLGDASLSGPDLRVQIFKEERNYPVPLHARRVLNYGDLRAYYCQGRMFFTDYFSTLELRPEEGLITGNLSEETLKEFGPASFVDLLFLLSLFEMLRFRGLYYLHAAGVADEEGVGYLICGNAGSGKTTLTIHLLLRGYRFLSDDTVFLRPRGDEIEALGYARDFHLPEDLVKDLKESGWDPGPLPSHCVERKRKLLDPERFFRGGRLDSIRNPLVILFPELTEAESSLVPLPAEETVSRLIPQSLSVMFNRENAEGHLKSLRLLAERGKGFRLLCGPELKRNPAKTESLAREAKKAALSEKGGAS